MPCRVFLKKPSDHITTDRVTVENLDLCVQKFGLPHANLTAVRLKMRADVVIECNVVDVTYHSECYNVKVRLTGFAWGNLMTSSQRHISIVSKAPKILENPCSFFDCPRIENFRRAFTTCSSFNRVWGKLGMFANESTGQARNFRVVFSLLRLVC